MIDMETLEAISQMLDQKLDQKLEPINKRLDTIDERLDTIDERLSVLEDESKITRQSVNTLLEWAEDVQVQVKIPLFQKAK